MPLNSISVVGAGGNGSIFITHLCRIQQAWTQLGGTPFSIRLYDPDMVTEANLARQVFCEADIGQPKALVLAQRMLTFFGVEIEPKIQKYSGRAPYYGDYASTVVVGCSDNLNARRAMDEACRKTKWTARQWGEDHEHTVDGAYWLDLGNSDTTGQVILGGHGLPTFFDVLPHMKKARDPKNLPSCSMAEALSRQDLFINSTVATLGANLLWQMMRHGRISHHGYFINLTSGRIQPIPVPA